MFNIGFTEMMFLGILALVLIGPKQLPEVARSIGKMINEFKRSTSAFTEDIKNATREFRSPISSQVSISTPIHIASNSSARIKMPRAISVRSPQTAPARFRSHWTLPMLRRRFDSQSALRLLRATSESTTIARRKP